MLRKTIINGRVQFVVEKPLINNIINKKAYTPYVAPKNIEIKPEIPEENIPLKMEQPHPIYNPPSQNIMNYKYNNIPNIIELNHNISHLKPNITIEYKTEIPYNIFQTWHTLDLPFYMNENAELLKSTNDAFNYYIYDDSMCREFIKSYYDDDTLFAFDSLIPGAYKADLWRYCILYVYGGIYLDIKYKCVNDFKLSTLLNKEHYVKDYYDGIYQALLVCLPKNKILMNCIHQIIINVKTKSYLSDPLSITGPQLMNKYFKIREIQNLEMVLKMPHILLNNVPILEVYSEYKTEQTVNQLHPHYSIMWQNKMVYA
jgi:mannosyltransferase OCH1-like enzyme